MLFVILVSIILISSILLNIALFILVRIQFKKQEVYNTWILDCLQTTSDTLEQMREIDQSGVFSTRINEKGIFESDDQVGEIFKKLVGLIERLNQRIQ